MSLYRKFWKLSWKLLWHRLGSTKSSYWTKQPYAGSYCFYRGSHGASFGDLCACSWSSAWSSLLVEIIWYLFFSREILCFIERNFWARLVKVWFRLVYKPSSSGMLLPSLWHSVVSLSYIAQLRHLGLAMSELKFKSRHFSALYVTFGSCFDSSGALQVIRSIDRFSDE